MRNKIRFIIPVSMLLCTTASAVAATPSEFYASLMKRGVMAYGAGRYDEAVGKLRLAAFGFVDSIENYQTAQVYLTLSYEKLGEADKARESAQRVVAAQKVSPKFADIDLPEEVERQFSSAAAALLSSSDAAMLRRTGRKSTSPSPAVTPPQQTTPQQTPPQQTPPQLEASQQAPPSVAAPPPPTTTPPSPSTTPPAAKAPPPPSTTTTTSSTSSEDPTATRAGGKDPSNHPSKQESQAQKAPPLQKPPPPQQPPAKPAATTSRKPAEPPETASVKKSEETKATTHAQPPASTPMPAPKKPAPQPATLSAQEIAAHLAAGERALESAQLQESRRIYHQLLDTPGLDHQTLIRVGEGLYRGRDFQGALAAFAKVGTLGRGEEPYHYYIAVAAFESGRIAQAKDELAKALPYIEITPDVARYRTKIEGASAP